MKKILSSLLLITILAVMAVPLIGLAQPMEGCTLRHRIILGDTTYDSGAVLDDTEPAWGMFCLLDSIYTITDWIFYILIAVTGLLVIVGGATIATAGGSSENISKGRNFIMYAMLGLAVALLSKAVPAIVKALMGA